MSGVVSKDHVDMHIEYPPRLALSDLVKRLKGRTSRLLQAEFPKLKERLGQPLLGNRLRRLEQRQYHG